MVLVGQHNSHTNQLMRIKVDLFDNIVEMASSYGKRGTTKLVLDDMGKLRSQHGKMPDSEYERKWTKLCQRLYGLRDWRELRYAVRKRANDTCEMCSVYGEHMHHIKTVHSRPDLIFELSNVMWVCADCHRKEHCQST